MTLTFGIPMIWTVFLVFRTTIPPIQENVEPATTARKVAAQTGQTKNELGLQYNINTDVQRWTALQHSHLHGDDPEETNSAEYQGARSEKMPPPFMLASNAKDLNYLELEGNLSAQANRPVGRHAHRTCTLRTRSELELRNQMREYANAWRENKLHLYVQHMNKAGGSTLCGFFGTSTFRVPEQSNCNGKPELSNILKTDTMQVQRLMSENEFDIYFNENPMHSGDLVNDVAYVTSIRKPEDRIVSQMLHHWGRFLEFDGEGRLVNLSRNIDRYLAEDRLGGVKSIYLSNMQTRHLVGVGTENVDMEEIYRKAVDRLAKFVFTIPTDRMGEGLVNLEFFLGHRICSPTCTRIRRNTHGAESQVRLLVQTDVALYERLLDENFYDTCLYLQAQLFHIEQSSVLNMFRRFNAV